MADAVVEKCIVKATQCIRADEQANSESKMHLFPYNVPADPPETRVDLRKPRRVHQRS